MYHTFSHVLFYNHSLSSKQSALSAVRLFSKWQKDSKDCLTLVCMADVFVEKYRE